VQLKIRPSVKEVILMRLTLDFYDMYTALFDRPPHRVNTLLVLAVVLTSQLGIYFQSTAVVDKLLFKYLRPDV
jgi:hypothetical protein